MSDHTTRGDKAVAVIKAMGPQWINPPPIHTEFSRKLRDVVPPPKPDPTFTLIGFTTDMPVGSIVYFMYSAGRVKIGYSATIRSRHRGLKNAGAFPPLVLLVIKGTETLERKLHKQFAKDRLHGEWFALSKEVRTFLRQRLCDVGRSTLDRAEGEYRDYCAAFVAAYKPLGKALVIPAKDKPKPVCAHGLPLGLACPPCVRSRDLAILQRINDGTYSETKKAGDRA